MQYSGLYILQNIFNQFRCSLIEMGNNYLSCHKNNDDN
jgi:hypothetical protein